MSLQRIAEFPERLPCRVRAGLALHLVDLVSAKIDGPFAQSIVRFDALGWEWVNSDFDELGLMYEAFDKLHEEFTELVVSQASVGEAAFFGAYCVLWEAYSEGWDLGRVQPADLPAEVAEGDSTLWTEFANSIEAVNMILPEGLERGIDAALESLAGRPDDRSARISRDQVSALFGTAHSPPGA
jgi:hypothetical protein